jgi:hypothetical protein
MVLDHSTLLVEVKEGIHPFYRWYFHTAPDGKARATSQQLFDTKLLNHSHNPTCANLPVVPVSAQIINPNNCQSS